MIVLLENWVEAYSPITSSERKAIVGKLVSLEEVEEAEDKELFTRTLQVVPGYILENPVIIDLVIIPEQGDLKKLKPIINFRISHIDSKYRDKYPMYKFFEAHSWIISRAPKALENFYSDACKQLNSTKSELEIPTVDQIKKINEKK